MEQQENSRNHAIYFESDNNNDNVYDNIDEVDNFDIDLESEDPNKRKINKKSFGGILFKDLFHLRIKKFQI